MAKIETSTRAFVFDGLQPDKTYRAVVRAYNSKGKEVGRSANIEFKTTPKNEPPPSIENLTGEFYGGDLLVRWDYPVRPKDVTGFLVTFKKPGEDFEVQGSVNGNFYRFPELVNIDSFGSFQGVLEVTVQAIDSSRLVSAEVTITVTVSATPDPTNVSVTSAVLGYELSWDDPDFIGYSYTAIYESLNSDYSDEELVYTAGSTPTFVPCSKTGAVFVRISHFSVTGIESNRVASNPTSVIVQNPAVVDTDPPDQRTGITYTPGIGQVVVSWTNPTGTNNEDIAGVTVRYSKQSDPSNYSWSVILFTYNDQKDTLTIDGLVPNTNYLFSISAFDRTLNSTAFSTEQVVTVGADSTPPPKPAAPIVSAGASAGGPFTIRITQDSIEDGTTNPLPQDTAYFKIFMLNAGVTSGPAADDISDGSATEIGVLISGYDGSSSQGNFYVALEDGEQRYFYTRAVDTSGNISDASDAVVSTEMTVISDAYISNLSADKITTGTLSATQYIDVGPTSSSRIRIESYDDGEGVPLGRIFSGLSPESGGGWSDQDTGFYLDHTGLFSIKDRLIFNGTSLTITGDIYASGGYFTGSVGISSGSIWMGTPSYVSGTSRIVINSSAIGGYDGSNTPKFILTNAGVSQIAGWTFTTTSLISPADSSGGTITLDSSLQRLKIGLGSTAIGITSKIDSTSIKINNSPILLWAGSENPDAWTYSQSLGRYYHVSGDSKFIVNASGEIFAKDITLEGKIYGSTATFQGSLSNSLVDPTNTTSTLTRRTYQQVSYNIGDAPTIEILKTSDTSEQDGSISFIRPVGTNKQGIKWSVKDSNSTVTERFSIENIGGSGGYLSINAYQSSTSVTPGIIKLISEDASDGDHGEIHLEATDVISLSIKDTSISSPVGPLGINSVGRIGVMSASDLQIEAGYINASDQSTTTNRITYSNTGVVDYYAANSGSLGSPREGDIHFRY